MRFSAPFTNPSHPSRPSGWRVGGGSDANAHGAYALSLGLTTGVRGPFG